MGEFRDVPNLINCSEQGKDLDYIKKSILEAPDRFIGSAINEILKKEKHLKLTPLGINKFIVKVLKGLFPNREAYWNDKDLVDKVREVIERDARIELVEEGTAAENKEEESAVISSSDIIARWQEKNGK